MSGNNLRLFVALDIPQVIKDLYGNALDELQGELGSARWVKPGNLHMTLKFIGNYDEEKLESLSVEVRKAAGRCPGFTVALGGCGAFPSSTRARIIWVGMREGKEEATSLARRIDSRLEKVGVKRESRPFRGHLTLSRLKQPGDCSLFLKDLESRLEVLPEMPFEVGEVIVYRSILSPKGPTYTPLERISLGGV